MIDQSNPSQLIESPPAPGKHPFLVALGHRVRALRAQRGVSRKTLAHAAEVSERHLANLEYGVGNASILVLLQVAQALDCTLQDLLAESPAKRARPIALVGLRGAGKSTLGAMLAADLAVPFVEISRLIEERAGGHTGEIIGLVGNEGYRRHARRALEQVVSEHPDAVLATPGGIAGEDEIYEWLLGHCLTVWLHAAPEEHMRRVIEQGDLRPMAASNEAMADLKAILGHRSPAYARAEVHVDTSAQPLQQTFELLRNRIRSARTPEPVRAVRRVA
ncbi:MAG: helix-turn-helix transcriptional regulator [Burkholderiaceae bacterium]